jgi:Zn finger protein HypA/HybF involved in hydrogenase expression
MRKKKYKKLVKELQAQVLGLETKLEALKPFIERQTLVNRYEATLPYGKNAIKCPRCSQETYVKVHASITPRCYSCNYPKTPQGSIDTWFKENK